MVKLNRRRRREGENWKLHEGGGVFTAIYFQPSPPEILHRTGRTHAYQQSTGLSGFSSQLKALKLWLVISQNGENCQLV